MRWFLEEREQGYVLAVNGKEYVWRGVSQMAIQDLVTQHLPPPAQWQRLSAGEGSQGLRLYSCWRRLHQTQVQHYHRQRRALKIVLADLQL